MLIGINSELLLGSHDQVIGDVVLSVHQHLVSGAGEVPGVPPLD